jgi:hypothetical protein
LAEALHRYDLPWIRVGRIYRRICFLRFEGRGAEATQIELTELKEAVDAARRESPSGPEADSILKRLLEEEGERVADAVAFAEAIMPYLPDHLAAARPAVSPSASGAPMLQKAGPRPAGDPRTVADFIEDMLAQDRPRAR